MKFVNAMIYDSDRKRFFRGSIEFTDKIISIEEGTSNDGIDLSGKMIIPGLIDIHSHGRHGSDFLSSELSGCNDAALHYIKHGVTTIFPCVMTAEYDDILKAIDKLKRLDHVNVDGIHIEGPYVSPKRPGCHNVSKLRRLDVKELEELHGAISPLKTHITVAPELEGGDEFIKIAKALGCTLGIGHSDASYDECMHAIDIGCTSFTHTYNAMRPLNHREPGAVGAALISGAYAEFICDGFHVHPEVIRLGYRSVGNERFVIVSDSISAADMPDGVYSLSDMTVTVKGAEIRNEEGVIAGSGLNVYDAVLNLMKFASIPFEEAIICATLNPARLVGIDNITGALKIGNRADLCIIDDSYNIEKVFVKGTEYSE